MGSSATATPSFAPSAAVTIGVAGHGLDHFRDGARNAFGGAPGVEVDFEDPPINECQGEFGNARVNQCGPLPNLRGPASLGLRHRSACTAVASSGPNHPASPEPTNRAPDALRSSGIYIVSRRKSGHQREDPSLGSLLPQLHNMVRAPLRPTAVARSLARPSKRFLASSHRICEAVGS